VTALLDSSVVLAAADTADRNHAAAAAWFDATVEPLAIGAVTLAECEHVLQRALGPVAADAFLDAIIGGAIDVLGPTGADLARARDLRRLALDPRCSLSDALTVTLVERLGAARVATFDRRPYSVLRSVAGAWFDFVP
jgi:uncharacterized protein